jgi:hypothetical protein
MTDRKVMQQALECLEWRIEAGAYGHDIEGTAGLLRALLAEPQTCEPGLQVEGPEPVAWALSHSRGIEFSSRYPMQESRDAAEQLARQHMGAVTVTPLYTAPPPQQQAEPVHPFLTECVFKGDPPAPYENWIDAMAAMLRERRIQRLFIRCATADDWNVIGDAK